VFCIAAVLTIVDGGCTGGWQSNFGNEYCFDSGVVTHATARSRCQYFNSELASITSDAECDYVAALMSVKFYTFEINQNYVMLASCV